VSIYDLLRHWSKETPDSIAIAATGRSSLSYARLCAQIDDVATQLNSARIGHNDRVAVAITDGPEAAVTNLGVACSAVCVPLDPRLQAGELDRGFSDLDVKAVITSQKCDR
jgi:acyl-CoA synthetase (AMP-forming)/AMP-acid ligase II